MAVELNEATTRRSFLFGSTVFALLTGCSSLPNFGRPRKDDTLIVLLSDCHVGDGSGVPTYQRVKFAECIARVLRLDPLPAKMIIPGDLAYLYGHKQDYALSRKLLQPVIDAGIEITIGMGNHDRRENFLEYWPEYAKRTQVPGRIVTKISGKYVDYIMIDTLNEPNDTTKWITPGALDDTQREWLRAECAAAKRPVLVMAHHPAGELGYSEQENTRQSAQKFGELIMGPKKAPTKCCGYIHGHNHRWYSTRDLMHWSSNRIGKTLGLPSTGHWGDIGYALIREYPDKIKATLVQYDFFSPKPLDIGVAPRTDWQAIVRDNNGQTCTFIP